MRRATPSKYVVASRNLAHVPTADWRKICIAAKGTANQHVEVEAKVAPMVQVDHQHMSAAGNEDFGLQAKATLLTMVDTEFGYVDLT